MSRHQLPAYSPLSLGALLRGLAAIVDPGSRERLRERLAQRFDADRAILLDSGTSALRVALEISRRRGREPVALPAYTCFDVATAAVGAGTSVVFYDLDPGTLAPDRDSLTGALDAGARTLVVSPLLGYQVDWSSLRDLSRQHDLLLIEDAAQAVGSSWRGGAAGTWGDLTVLSFGRGKGWTGGGGGALLARGEWVQALDIAEDSIRQSSFGLFRELRTLATTGAQLVLGRPALFGIPSSLPFLALGETHYRPPHPPAAMASSSAGIVLGNEGALAAEEAFRHRVASWYRRELNRCGVGTKRHGGSPGERAVAPIHELDGTDPSHLRFGLRIRGGIARLAALGPAHVLGLREAYPRPLYRLPATEPLLARPARRFPGAEELASSLVTAPTHSLTTEADRSAIVALLGRADA